MEFIANNFVPLLFAGLLLFLLTGFPVAFCLAATGLTFGLIGMEAGLFPPTLFQALPLRIFGIMQNDTLLAVPFFTFMGIILERSGMAEDLLETVGQMFGPLRGGLALATIFVGALLAATTGVIAAAVISMGLISLPIMLRYGYNRSIATGVITASGTLAQIIPPSLVLIVMADQLGRSVGDMYAGAIVPGLILVGLFALFIVVPGRRPAELGARPAAGGAHLPGAERRQRAPFPARGRDPLGRRRRSAGRPARQHRQPAPGTRRRGPDGRGDHRVDDRGGLLRAGARPRQPLAAPRAAVAALRAGGLRAAAAAGADLPRAGNHLSRYRHADGGRGHGRHRRADHGRCTTPARLSTCSSRRWTTRRNSPASSCSS